MLHKKLSLKISNFVLPLIVFSLSLLFFSCEKNDKGANPGNYVTLHYDESRIGNTNVIFFPTDGEIGYPDLNNNNRIDEDEKFERGENGRISFPITSTEIRIYGDYKSINAGAGLKGIDISNHPSLTGLTAGGITDFRAKNNNALKTIRLYRSKFTSFNSNDIPNVTTLAIIDGILSSIDLSKYPALEYLDLNNNKLTALDLTKNKNVSRLDIFNNNIKSDKMQLIINALKNAHSNEITYAVVYGTNYPSGPDGNVTTKAQVQQLKAKGWRVYQQEFVSINSTKQKDYGGM